MVKLWLPEPPRGVDDSFHLEGGVQMLVESDESDEEGFDHMGYVLLPPDMAQSFSNESENSVGNDSDNDSDVQEASQSDETSTSGDTEGQVPVEASASGSSRSDIVVNCDVHAAMSNVTLPPSAIPSWAAEIPESHWTSFLMTRINNLQTGTGIK